ncbi:Minichromosome maintenance domain-containing protein 2 [Podila verticillata]|nr:Minichromosome maintenance domain-containing protein 2 [Podila verticillata]
MQQQSRSHSFAGKSAGPDLPAMSSSTSSLSSSRHGRERDQEQVEEALRASLSTLLATGPRPKFKQRRNRPRKIYTVDTRSQRSSVPASPTHLYYSTNASPHMVPTNPDSLGDLSPHYFHGTLSPYSRDYDSASSDSEQVRQKKAYPRGILSTGESPYSRAHDHYYEIESSTLNSNDPPFSGSTTPYSPLYSQANKCIPGDHVTKTVLQGPSSLLAARYVSWSVKAQSILDHISKDTASIDGHSSVSSSASSSPHSSPSTSGASTPSRIRRKRCSIPEPHQGFFSRALDQRSLASHVSVSRVGIAGTNCSPLHLGLRAGVMIRGSSPLRPTTSPMSPNTPSTTPPYPFSTKETGVLKCRQEGKEDGIVQGAGVSDDKENKRWYGQETGLNLWQTTLGAAVLLGTGFGTGHSKLYIMERVEDFNPQSDMDRFFYHQPSELSLEEFDVDDQITMEESDGSILLDAEVPSLAHELNLESSVRSLRERFLCTHPMAEKVKRRQAKSESTVNRYNILIVVDPMILLDDFPSLGNQLINDYNLILPDFRVACNGILQSMLEDDTLLFSEQVRLQVRLLYLPSVAEECHLLSIASALAVSQESKIRDKNIYTGFFTLCGRVSSVSLVESVIYSQVFLCTNRRCRNRNYLCFTPSATSHRIIKRTEEQEFMETSTNATLLDVDLLCGHCGENMPESIQDRVCMNQQRVVLDCVNEPSFEGIFHNQITVVLKDDLSGTTVLGEKIQLLGNLRRVFPENSRGNTDNREYRHGILFEVNNILRSRPPDYQMPECISTVLERNMSGWSTTQAIVDMIVPSHVYRKLKLALLLSRTSDLRDGTMVLKHQEGHYILSPKQQRLIKEPLKYSTTTVLFDLVILQHETLGASEISKSIAMAVLEKNLAQDSPLELIGQHLTPDDFSTYIRMASKIQVRLSSSCSRLLQEYFQTLRKGLATNHLQSVATMSTLLRVAACHAKLSFRAVADMEDALVSIMMVEETMAARFGRSRLGFVPLPDGEENVVRLYGNHTVIPDLETQGRDEEKNLPRMCPRSIGEERDEMLARMRKHLLQVITDHGQ